MKRLHKLLVLFAVIILSASSYAQGSDYSPKETVLKKAYEVCPQSLNSDVSGIVEASIYNVILLKKYYPSADYSNIVDKLNEIAEKNVEPSIRFKAHLASIYMSFNEIINIQPKFNFDHEYIYKQITNQLEKNLVVKN
jgi:putative cell wall-binding protein